MTAGEVRSLGVLLREHRLAAGLTQQELSALSQLSVRTISCLETGRTARPYERSVLMLASALALPDTERVILIGALRGHNGRAVGLAGPPDAITEAAGGTAVLAAQPPSAQLPPAQLPPDIGEFTGRTGQIAWLSRLVGGRDPAGPVPVAVITGAGGLGKSALAVHVGHRLAADFPDGQLFIELQGSHDQPLASGDALARMLRHLGLADSAIPKDDAERAAEYRTTIAGRRMLIILDDARDAAQVRPLLPGTATNAVLVTSRGMLADLEGSRHLALNALDDAEALALFTSICGRGRVAAEPAAAHAVIAACSGLPLAVRIAASRLMSRPGWEIGALADRLADERRRLEELAVGDLAVRTSFRVSYAVLRRSAGDDVARAFRLLGLWPGPDISLPAAAALLGLDAGSAARTLEKLVDVHMLQALAGRRYRFHDLIRVYAAECAEQDETPASRALAIRRLLSWYLHTADRSWASVAVAPRHRELALAPVETGVVPLTFSDYDKAADWRASERDHLVAAVMLAVRWQLHRMCIQLAESVWQGYLRSPWDGWARVLEAAVDSAAAVGEQGSRAWLLNYLSVVLMYRGNFHEALARLQEALALSRSIGDPHSEAAITGHLAVVCKQLQRYDEAIDHFERVLTMSGISRTVVTGRIQMNLGMLYVEVGRPEEGASQMEQALALLGDAGDHQATSLSLSQLADAYRQLDRHDDALRCARSALDLSRRLRDQYHEVAALAALGQIMADAGDIVQARSYLASAYGLARELGVPEATQIAASMAALGASDNG